MKVEIFISNGVIDEVKKSSEKIKVLIYINDELHDEDTIKEFRDLDRVVTIDGEDYIVTEW